MTQRMLIMANIIAAVVLLSLTTPWAMRGLCIAAMVFCWCQAIRSYRLSRETKQKADRCERAMALLRKGLANLTPEETTELVGSLQWLHIETGQDCFLELLRLEKERTQPKP